MVQVAGLIVNHATGFCFIMPRCYSAGGSALSFRWVLLFSIMQAVYIIMPRVLLPIMPRGVIVNHSAGGSALSFRGVLLFSIIQAVYIIMPRVLLSIMPRGSALSCRWVLLFSIMQAVYIIIPRCLLPIMPRVHGSGSRYYCLSFRGVYCLSGSGYMVQVTGLIAYHSAWL